MVDSDAQAYIDARERTRGAFAYHKVMALHDYNVLKATNGLAHATYDDQRTLDPKTKELLFIFSLTVLRAGTGFLTSHMQRALDLGLSSREILETIEMALPVAGIVAFLPSLEVWREVTKAEGIEPTIALHQSDEP